MRQGTKGSAFRKSLHGFTLVELLVVIAIIALLLGMMMPVLGKAREKARNMICVANMKSIAASLIAYTVANSDITPVQTEAPNNGVIVGSRTLPLILKDQKFLDISDKRGGVWRCPRDLRQANPHFKAWYYYHGGPGNPAECPYAGLFMSYNANSLYRPSSPKCPWSYYESGTVAKGGVMVARKLNSVKQPATKVMFFDGGNCWDVSEDYPFKLFYDDVLLQVVANTQLPFSLEPWYRHNPKGDYAPGMSPGKSPIGNIAFMDGHVEVNKEYLSTCGKKIMGKWISLSKDSAISARWWSADGTE